ncbi:MAG: 30S ribosomal S1 [Trebouxia sp. A1-2]|nr:MAG: 30S ribosomal S1 [Trebouxia sp. A1-2]
MHFTGLQAPALHSDLAPVLAQRVVLPCHLHLSCSHHQPRSQALRSVARSSTCRHDSAQSDCRNRKHCLGHANSKHERRCAVQTCAVADEVREAVAQSGSAGTPAGSSQNPPQQPQSEDASTALPSTSSAEQSVPTQAGGATAVPAEASQASESTSTSGIAQAQALPAQPAPPQPSAPQPKTPYRGFKNKQHSNYQDYDGQKRIDLNPRPNGGRGPAAIPIPPEEAAWLLPGQTVIAKVVYSNPNGFKVEMLDDPRVGGWCPVKEAPYVLRERQDDLKLQPDDLTKLTIDIMPIGTVREFRIMKTPQALSYHGVGPMVSARVHDLDTLWARTFQLFDLCTKDKETFTVTVLDVNQGGLICRCQSLQAFIPISQLNRERDTWLSPEDMAALKGKDVEVTVIEVDPEFKKIVLSMSRAVQFKQLRSIHLGALMWGEVRRVEEFGAFIGLEGTRISGLLHVSNISRSRVESVSDVFQIGERVRCLVMGMDENFTRISLSTAELEVREGDIMYDKEKVYAGAEAQAQLFMEYIQSSRDQSVDDDFDFDGEREYDGGSYDSAFAGNTRHNQA